VQGRPGCDAVAIPHNSNLSGGLMFETARLSSDRIPDTAVAADEAARRARWNPLFEVIQHKGSSECDSRIAVWAEDEYCDFEKLGYDTFGGKNTGNAADGSMDWLTLFVDDEVLPETRLPGESNFLRYALKKGLRQQAELGVNLLYAGKPRAGMVARFKTEDGQVPVTIIKLGRHSADVDTHHPLAGQTLAFDIEILEVRRATPEEISHGHVHGPGEHHH